ncbi:MAG: D-amino-acid transaminase [Pseudomonadota bacterium]
MPRIAYVNGRYVPLAHASVHIEDRGYQFADGVYEVVPLYRGRLLDEEPHLDRFDYSLSELRIAPPMSRSALKLVLRELVRRNGLADGLLYFQATRGVAPRDHKFPARIKTAFVATLRRAKPPSAVQIEQGVAVVTVPDIRWQRCDIKSISLLPNLLAKQAAAEAGAFEAWMVDGQGRVTEGSSTNAWIVTAGGALVTRDASAAILNGITRRRVIALLETENLRFEERPFTIEEARAAKEAFLTSSSSFVLPIGRIDGKAVGDGRPGPVAKRLREIYVAAALETPPL